MLAFYGIYMFCGCKITRFHLKKGWHGVTKKTAAEVGRQIRMFCPPRFVGGSGMGNADELKINLRGKMPLYILSSSLTID